jgi:hypothetical protein
MNKLKKLHYSLQAGEYNVKLLSTWGKTVDNGKVKLYKRDHSYASQVSFIRVWNEGTRTFKKIQNFSRIDFNEVHGVVQSLPISDRGKIQGCFGYSQQNSKGKLDYKTYMNKPQRNEGTKQVIPMMVVLSGLFSFLIQLRATLNHQG